jgi:leucyl aminopeptidase
MKNTHVLALLAFALAFVFSLNAFSDQPVLANLSALRAAGVSPLAHDEKLGVGYAVLTQAQEQRVSHFMHSQGKCGGYEALSSAAPSAGLEALMSLRVQDAKEQIYKLRPASLRPRVVTNPVLNAALGEANQDNIRDTVVWLSAYPSRYNKLPEPNKHVDELEGRIKEMLKNYQGQWTIEQISHNRTRQNSLRVHLEGTTRPTEIIVMGGHLDSINQGWSDLAPGADDNASGSASILEALRVIASHGPTERSLEFFWYAGEESGLLGSAEIAKQYKAENRDVIAVLQLDMTMYPGSGEMVVDNIQDNTSGWLRDYLVSANDAYLNVPIINDQCGYGCSDHASWYRQGYSTLMPFEASMNDMNPNIHSDDDVISANTSFKHALVFSKIAIIFGMDLGNSQAKGTPFFFTTDPR